MWGTRPRYSYEKHQTYPAGELNFNSKLSDLSESEPSVGAKIEEDEMKVFCCQSKQDRSGAICDAHVDVRRNALQFH